MTSSYVLILPAVYAARNSFIGASTSSLIGSLGPLFTIGFGALLLDEPVNLLQLIGVVLVLSGVVLVSRAPRSPRQAV